MTCYRIQLCGTTGQGEAEPSLGRSPAERALCGAGEPADPPPAHALRSPVPGLKGRIQKPKRLKRPCHPLPASIARRPRRSRRSGAARALPRAAAHHQQQQSSPAAQPLQPRRHMSTSVKHNKHNGARTHRKDKGTWAAAAGRTHSCGDTRYRHHSSSSSSSSARHTACTAAAAESLRVEKTEGVRCAPHCTRCTRRSAPPTPHCAT